MRTALAGLAVSAAALTPALAAPPAAGAAGDTIAVSFDAGQTLPQIDPHTFAVHVTVRSSDCSAGCRLYRVGRLRANETEVLLGSWTYPARSTPRANTVGDVLERTPGLSLRYTYELRSSDASWRAAADADPAVYDETQATYTGAWTRDANTGTTETLIERSTAAGAAAALPAQPWPRRVGVVSARGPRNGVMTVELAGRGVRTLDLRAAAWQPRQVVASVDVPAGAVLRVVNASPAGRADRDVHVDGFLVLDGTTRTPGGAADARSPVRAPDRAADEDLQVLPVVPQQVPAGGGPLRMAVTAHVHGCPSGCRVVRIDYDSDQSPVGDTVLLDVTSPASAGLQTLSVVTRPAGMFAVRLEKGASTVVYGPTYDPAVLPDSVFDHSDGWSLDSGGGSTGGVVLRAGRPGLGATYRVSGTFDGRPVGLVAARGPDSGVAAVYADGVLVRTVDLSAPTAQPRQVVAALQLPVTGRITVVNRTPAGRSSADVHVDGLVLLDEPDDFY